MTRTTAKREEGYKVLEESPRRFAFLFHFRPKGSLSVMIFLELMPILCFILVFIVAYSTPALIIAMGALLLGLELFAQIVFLLLNALHRHRVTTIDKVTGTIDLQGCWLSRKGGLNPRAVTRQIYPLTTVNAIQRVAIPPDSARPTRSVVRLLLTPSGVAEVYSGRDPEIAASLEANIVKFFREPYPAAPSSTAPSTATLSTGGNEAVQNSSATTSKPPTLDEGKPSEGEIIAAVGRIGFIFEYLQQKRGVSYQASFVSNSDRNALHQAYSLLAGQENNRVTKMGTLSLWFYAGVITLQLGWFTEAAAFFEASLTQNPKDAGTWNNLGIARNNLKDFKGAIEASEKAITLDPKHAKAWINLGDALGNLKDFNGSMKACEKAIALDPKSAGAWICLGGARFNLKDFKGALEASEKAIALDPKSAGAWICLGATRNRLKDYKGALEAFEKAVSLDPNFALGWSNLGHARYTLNDPKGALEACEKGIALDSNLAIAWSNLGHNRTVLNDLKGAIEACEKAVSLDPSEDYVWSSLGYARKGQGDLNGAIDALERALAINPENVDTWNYLGQTFELLQNEPEALYCFERSAALEDEEGQRKVEEMRVRGVSARAIQLPNSADKSTSSTKI